MGTLKIITAHQQFKKEAMKKEHCSPSMYHHQSSTIISVPLQPYGPISYHPVIEQRKINEVNKFINNDLLRLKLIDLIKGHWCDKMVLCLDSLLWVLGHKSKYIERTGRSVLRYVYPEYGVDTRCQGLFVSVICYLMQNYDDFEVDIFTDSEWIFNRVGTEIYKNRIDHDKVTIVCYSSSTPKITSYDEEGAALDWDIDFFSDDWDK